MSDHLPPFWIERVCRVLLVEPYPEATRLFEAWARAEGGSARYNPLNTTYSLFGATDYNNVGVKNYARPVDGVCATALTIANGFYQGIWSSLQMRASAKWIVREHAAEFDRWGTGAANILRVLR